MGLATIVDLDDQRVRAGGQASSQLHRVRAEASCMGGEFLAIQKHAAGVVGGADVQKDSTRGDLHG